MHDADRDYVVQLAKQHIEGLTPEYACEHRMVAKDGSIRWIEVRGRIERDADGRPWRIVGTDMDITARKEAESVRDQTRQRLDRVLATMPGGIIVFDRDRHVTFGNASAAVLLDTDSSTMVGPWLDTSQYEIVDSCLQPIDEDDNAVTWAFQWGTETRGSIVRVRTPAGTARWFSYNVAPLERDTDEVSEVIVSFHDITEERRHQEQLRCSVVEREHLLKEMHHRVKNNLAVLESIINLERERGLDSGTLRLFDDIADRIHSITLLHQMLYSSEDLSTVRLDDYLSSLVRHLVATFRGDAPAVYPQFDLEPVELDIDTATRIGHIATELITNALKYGCAGHADAYLLVSLTPSGSSWELTIRDGGEGLGDDFDPEDGNTLGMKLVSALVGQIDGRLEYGSDNGAWFRISMPDAS